MLVASLAAGCGAVGRVTTGDPGQGKALFNQKCAACHTLGDAKSQGQIGPNLDYAFGSDKAQGFSEQTIRDVVRGQIAYPEKPMPPNLVRGAEADAVAMYVAKCAANTNCGVTANGQASSGGSTGAAGGSGAAAAPQGASKPDGKAIFASAGCGGCHTLKDAGTSGNVGPNLDSLKPSQSTVANQVTHGGGGMPAFKGRLSDAQIQAVATYVSGAAGK